MRVLVTGPAGFLGRALVPRLLAEGHVVRALVRRAAPEHAHERLECVSGDVLVPASLAPAVAGVDAIVHLATASAREGAVVARAVNVEGTRHLLEAAAVAGVRRFVFTSTISTTRERKGPYGETKLVAERLVERSGLDWVTLRPSLVYGGVESGLVAMLAATIRALPVVPVIGPGQMELDPIHRDDVCDVIAQCLTRDDVTGRSYDLLGPERLTFNAFVERIGARLGVRRPRLHLPGGLMLLGASVLGRLMRSPPLSTDNVLGMLSPAQVDGAPARRDFAVRWTTLEEGLRELLLEDGEAPEPPPDAPASPRPRRPVRVAVAGLGKMGLAHTSVLANIPRCTLVGLTDHSPKLARSLRGMGHRAPFFSNLEALLAEARPDALFVCAPQHAHWPIARRAIEAGVAVFVEKPLTHTLEDAESLAELARRRGVPVACGYTLAHWPVFAAARDALAAGTLDGVRSARGAMFLSQVFGPKRGWMYERARSGGGVVANVSSHLLYLLDWYLGPPRSVRATARHLHGEVEDELTAVLVLPGGAEVRFESSWSVAGYPVSDVRVEVEGGNGSLRVSAEALELDLSEARDGFAVGRTVRRAADLPQPARFELNGEGYYLEDAAFLEWITGGPEPPTSLPGAVRVQRTMDARYRSAAAGGTTVELSL